MTETYKDRLYRLGSGATVAISTALFASPFILVALYFIERALG